MIEYLDSKQVAARIGVKPNTLSRYKLPEPDATIGDRRGWLPDTIDVWNKSRPGKGRWGYAVVTVLRNMCAKVTPKPLGKPLGVFSK